MTDTGLHAAGMLSAGLRSLLLFGIEPEHDFADPAAAAAALRGADSVIAVVSHTSELLRETASLLLPLRTALAKKPEVYQLNERAFTLGGEACAEAMSMV